MRLALDEARKADRYGEVPVGAVVVLQGRVLGRGYNRSILDNDPTAHAEVIALREAATTLGNYRLPGCELFVTLEPCLMCAGALVAARIRRVVLGAPDAKGGAVVCNDRVLESPALNHRVEVVSGVLEDECRELLVSFFQRIRS